MLLTEITKKEVLDVNANKVGFITDVDVNPLQGTVSYFILRTGVFKKIPVTPDQIDKVGEKVILRITKNALEGKLTGASV